MTAYIPICRHCQLAYNYLTGQPVLGQSLALRCEELDILYSLYYTIITARRYSTEYELNNETSSGSRAVITTSKQLELSHS